MTVEFFITIFIVLSAISSLLTEAIKKFMLNAEKTPVANFIALIDALVVGGGGMVATYFLFNITFTPANIIAIVGMVGCVWIGSMIGYDKVTQLFEQIKNKF